MTRMRIGGQLRSSLATATSLGAALLVAACGAHGGEEQGQVIAQVGDQELTAPMLETALSAQPGIDARDKQVQRETSEKLIRQIALAEEARRAKVDRDPAVARRIEAAEREILATAYLERLVKISQPSRWQLRDFYDANPHLFADRKQFRLTLLAVPSTKADAALLTAAARGSDGIAALAQQLGAKGSELMVRQFSAPTEVLPDALARSLADAAPGARRRYRMADTDYLVEVMTVDPAPLRWDEARPMIEARLREAEFREAANRQLATLRKQVPVVYAAYGTKILGLKPATQ